MLSDKDKVLRHGTLILAGAFIGNVLSYLFHAVIARMLGPADYGSLVALMDLIVIISIPLITVQTLLTKEIAVFKARKEIGKAKFLFGKYLKLVGVFGIIAFAGIALLSPAISGFLHLNSIEPALILGVVVAATVFSVVINGALNGMQKFWGLNFSTIGNSTFKLLIAAVLVSFGFGLNGALGGVLAAAIASSLIGAFFLKSLLSEKAEKTSVKESLKYSFFILTGLLCVNLYVNLDVILVKNLFSGTEAGVYAALSQAGKIIFFLTSAITMVLLPKVSEAHSTGDSKTHRKILYKTLGIVALPSIAAIIAYFLFPKLVITVVFGEEFVSAAPLLGLFGTAIAFYALANILIMYFISASRKKFVFITVFFAILQAALIMAFHSSLLEIVLIMLALMGILFITLLAYSFIDRKVSADAKQTG